MKYYSLFPTHRVVHLDRSLEQFRDSRVELKLWEDEGKVEEEEDEEAEEEEEEDEGTLQVNCHKPKFWCCFSIQDQILKF